MRYSLLLFLLVLSSCSKPSEPQAGVGTSDRRTADAPQGLQVKVVEVLRACNVPLEGRTLVAEPEGVPGTFYVGLRTADFDNETVIGCLTVQSDMHDIADEIEWGIEVPPRPGS